MSDSSIHTYNRESLNAFSDRGGRVNDILIGRNDTTAVEPDPHFGNRRPASCNHIEGQR